MSRHLGGRILLPWVLVRCTATSPEGTVKTYVFEDEEGEILTSRVHLLSVRDLVATEQGLWVLDGAPPSVTRVSSPDGGVVQFGRRDQGPNEFLNPSAIKATTKADNSGVHVWDLGNVRASALDRAGKLVGASRINDGCLISARASLRDVSYANPVRVRSAGEDVVVGHFPGRLDRTADLAMGSRRRAEVDLTPGLELARFAGLMEQGAASLREWTLLPVWDAHDGEVVLWSPVSLEVVWLDLHGDQLGSERVEETPIPLNLEDIEVYSRWMARWEMGPGFEEEGID
jgi:hypothetical protein